MCEMCAYSKNLIFRLCCFSWARGGSHRGDRGFMAFARGTNTPLFTGTNWTIHYRPQTINERVVGPELVGPTGVPANAHRYL